MGGEMTPARWRQVRAVLEPALEVPPAEVHAWLATHCDPDLRGDVEALIAAARTDGTLLDAAVFRPEAVLDPGSEIGPYVIESLIGVGGMGVVYRATDPRLQRRVAIKLLTFGGREAEMLSEARAASALDHPNIVVIHDVLEYRDTPAIVMEYVEGERLDERLDAGPLTSAQATGYAQQIASALAASHDAGILHRDLKPANIIVRSDGTVKVLDFGIAHRMQEAARGGAQPAGTSGYAAPEQVEGRPLDVRADVYSFGAVLREMLRGRSLSDDSIPARWRPCFEKCLAQDPDERFVSMRAVEAKLATLAPRRRPRWPLAAAAALVIGVGLTAIALRTGEPPDPAPAFATQRLSGAEDGRAFPRLSPDGTTVVFSALVGGRLHLFVQPTDAVFAEPLGQDGRHAAWSPDGATLAFRSDRDGGGLFLLAVASGSVSKLSDDGFHPDWSPDGAQIVFSSEGFERAEERPTSRSVLSVIDIASGTIRPLTHRAVIGDAIQPAWSPDGTRIAFWSIEASAERSVWTIPAAGGPPVRASGVGALDWCPAWSPDGWLHWASDRAGTMNAWRVRIDAASGLPVGAPQPVPLPSNYAAYFSFANTGAMAFSAQSPTSSIWKAPLDSPGTAERLTPRTLQLAQPSVSPDGEWLAAFEETPSDNLVLMRTDGTEFHYLTTGEFRDRDPEWSPDGETVIFLSNRGGDYQLWQVAPDGGVPAPFVVWETGAFAPVWDPRGDQLAWFTRGFRPMRSNARGAAITELPMPATAGFRPTSWSPDGRTLAGLFRSLDGQGLGAALLDLGTGEYRPIDAPCNSPQWMPNGRLLCVTGRSLSFVDPATSAVTPARTLPHQADTAFDISPDGRWVYVTMLENQPEIWVATPRQ